MQIHNHPFRDITGTARPHWRAGTGRAENDLGALQHSTDGSPAARGREATPKHFLKWIPLVVQYEIHYANAVPVPEMVV
nr:hypothetical protein [Caballeronia choica]